MASWQEIDRVRKSLPEVRSVAERLLATPDLSSWETDFLQDISRIDDRDELTTRQAEKLLQIRDDAEFVGRYRGFSVRLLLDQCYLARIDLSEADEAWIVELRQRNRSVVRRRHIGRLIRCARKLHVLEDEDEAA
jgi:hypothetical protein